MRVVDRKRRHHQSLSSLTHIHIGERGFFPSHCFPSHKYPSKRDAITRPPVIFCASSYSLEVQGFGRRRSLSPKETTTTFELAACDVCRLRTQDSGSERVVAGKEPHLLLLLLQLLTLLPRNMTCARHLHLQSTAWHRFHSVVWPFFTSGRTPASKAVSGLFITGVIC